MEGEGRPSSAGQKCSPQCLLSSQDFLGPQTLKLPPPRWLDSGRATSGSWSLGQNLWVAGPWGCSSDNIPACVSSGARLLQYLLNNQPRNGIVQDKNEKHWAGTCCFFFGIQIPLGPWEGRRYLGTATSRPGRTQSWDIGHRASVPTSTLWDLECNSSVSPGAQERQLCTGS